MSNINFVRRSYQEEKKRILEIVSDVLNTPRMISCNIEISAEVDELSTVTYECKVVVDGTEEV